MTAEKLAELKQYMRVDHDDDDNVIKDLYATAVEYLTSQGISEGSKRFSLAAFALTLYWYDCAPTVVGKVEEAPLGIRQIINQLKLESGGVDYF